MTCHLRNPISRKFVKDVTDAMESIAPLKLADSTWDNVGLIADSPLALNDRLILVTNDLTASVVSEAVSKKASMIISYHPPWFKSSKNMRLDGPLSSINLCISHGISIFSPHTALDSISDGINDWICGAFKINNKFESINPIMRSKVEGFENCGFGRIIELNEAISLNQSVKLLKNYLKLENLRFGKARNIELNSQCIRRIAVCGGSGGSVFGGVTADLFVTGEMGHHQVLELCDRQNAHALLTEHSNCERGYLKDIFVPILEKTLKQVSEDEFHVLFSETDVQDPLTII